MLRSALTGLTRLRMLGSVRASALALVIACSTASALDLSQFTPDSAILGYSVFATRSIRLPDNSGLADGGAFGTAGELDLGNGMALRAPRLYAGGTFTLGGNPSGNVPKTWIGGDFDVSSGPVFADTLQILGNFVSGAATLTFNAPVGVKGNLSLSGSNLKQNRLLRLGGTWSAPGMTFGAGASIEMAAATGGPGGAPGGTTYNKPWTPLMDDPPHVAAMADLPAYAVVGYAAPGTRPVIDLSSPANFGTDKPVQFLSGSGTTTTKTAYYWTCNLGAAFCSGDTLLPGYYGALTLTGNSRALLLKEGFYAFASIHISSSNALVAAQPTAGRTVVYSDGPITSDGSNAFIGPDSARLATGFGKGAGKFQGGTMMLAGGKGITIPSDLRIWATISAPRDTIHFSSQVTLFGQAYADVVIGDNNVDFGKGAFIPFRGLVPALFSPTAFTVAETADPACSDTSGRPCRDTVLNLRLPYTTAYTVKVRYRILETSPRQAILGEDFPYDTGHVVIAPGDTFFPLRVRVFDDSSYEAPETFRIVFDSLHGAGCPDANGNADTTIKSCEAVGTIVDDDRAPRLEVVADSAVHEGDAGRRGATFTVRLLDPYSGAPLAAENAPQVPVSFRWSTVDGSGDSAATRADSDYVGIDGRRDTLPLRGIAMTISDSVRGDARHERDERFLISLDSLLGSDPSGSVLLDTAWILDDDTAPGVRLGDAIVQEPSVAGDTAWILFPVTLTRPSGLPVALEVGAADSTARAATDPVSGIPDYVAPTRRIVVPPDSLGDTLRVAVLGDTLYETLERFKALLVSAQDAVLDDSVGVGTILDADSAPVVHLDTAWIVEPLSGTADLVFRVHLSRPSGLSASLVWSVAPGTAMASIDYSVAANTSLPLRAGLRDTVLRVSVLADSVAGEGVETLSVSLSALDRIRAGTVVATGRIVDAQGLPRISVADIGPFVESDTTVSFPVSLDWYPADTVRVPWGLVAGSAPAGGRWLPDSGELVFAPGARFAAIAVRLRDDRKGEPDAQDFFALLGTPVNGRYGDSLGRAALLDDGDEPYATIADAAPAKEGTSARFLLRLERATPNPVAIRWSFVPGTAGDDDVSARSGVATFVPGGPTSFWVEIPAVVDTLWEPAETFSVHLDSCGDCMIRAADSTGDGSILEEGDLPRVAFLGGDTSVVEDRAGTVRVAFGLTRAASIPLFAALLPSAASTAARPADWSFAAPSDDTLRFPAGSRSLVVRLPVVPDTLEEPTETVILDLSSSSPLAAGSKSRWTLTILDDDHRPAVEIRKPVDSLRTNVPGHVVEWTVDGVAQPPRDTTLREGWNTIVRTHVDTFGHVASDTHVVWADFTPPEVRVFKIVGPDPLHPERDTTWWGDRARTRFGVDTVWYWVRDSAMLDDGSWTVSVDTLKAVTGFSGDGVFPKEVSACDELGNCGRDTGWIDLKQSIPQVTIDDPKDGQKIETGDVPVGWHVVDGGKRIERMDTTRVVRPGAQVVQRCWTDDVGNTGCDTTHPVADTVRVVSGVYVDLDHDGRIDAAILTLDVPWVLDTLPAFDLPLLGALREGVRPDTGSSLADARHLVVPLDPPFDYGITGFPVQTGRIRQTWLAPDGVEVVASDSFPIADGAAPAIVDAEITRVENYQDPDTVRIELSEPVSFDSGTAWLEVGSCPSGVASCDPATVVWRVVPEQDVSVLPDGRLQVLVQPGDSGSVHPGDLLRFLSSVSDTLGNAVDTGAVWATPVRGAPRPELVKVDPPTRIPVISTSEQNRVGPGGVRIRASRGSSTDGQWWEPGRGYLEDGDPAVQEVCPDPDFCNGPSLYINRPVRMVLYIYDLAGTYAISRTIDITQEDIDALEGDKIDRLRITLEWNHRSEAGEVVGSGIYVWRIVAQTRDRGRSSGIQNIVWKTGVKMPRR